MSRRATSHVFDPDRGQSAKLTVGVAADLKETRPRYVTGTRYIRNAGISPSGARAVFEFRGDIVTVPAGKGDHRHLMSRSASHERSPAWFTGREVDRILLRCLWRIRAAHRHPRTEREKCEPSRSAARASTRTRSGPRTGRRSATRTTRGSLYVLDLESGRSRKIAQEPYYGEFKTLHHAWSPDSRWLAYTLNTQTYFQQVYLYSVEEGDSHLITKGLSDVTEPVFDAGREVPVFRRLLTNAGPVRDWFALSNQDMLMAGSLYLTVLAKGVESPLAKESDEQVAEEGGEGGEETEGIEVEEVRIDFEDLDHRILALPVDKALYTDLQPGPAGQLYYLRRDENFWRERSPRQRFSGPGSLRRFDLEKRGRSRHFSTMSTIMPSLPIRRGSLLLSGDNWIIADAKGKIDASKGRISAEEIQARIDPPG